MKILLVEDNNDLATEILALLSAKRMTVERVATIASARDYLAGSTYDLILTRLELARRRWHRSFGRHKKQEG